MNNKIMDSVFNEDFESFLQHFPLQGDLILKFLKGHLLIEKSLREIFNKQLSHPKAINGNKGIQLSCHQIICLTEALVPISQSIPWIWDALRKLNSIRNELAHQLSPKDIEKKIDDLINYTRENTPQMKEIMQESEIDEHHALVLTFLSMFTCISALRGTLARSTY